MIKKLSFIAILAGIVCIFGCTTISNANKTLKAANNYERTNSDLNFTYSIDENRAEEIRNYFSENTTLNLNEIYKSDASVWEKTLQIATFVSENIPHANQRAPMEKIDCIYLWEYHMNIENAFNCKFHSFLTNELLLSVGILNHIVWCMPKSDKDPDCHVVNNVWIPELSKWVMIDTDQRAYICNKDAQLLSIQEIRENLISDEELIVYPIAAMKQKPKDYLDYLSKDFYWFTTIQKTRFVKDGSYSDRNFYINLLPVNFNGFNTDESDICTNDDAAFWIKP